MSTKTYPIGTRIKFLFGTQDKDKTGRIVGVRAERPLVLLDKPCRKESYTWNDIAYSWWAGWEQIEPLKKQQLMFSFMYD